MYIPTIGLEIHAELKTKTKMFCGCPNDAEERHPNTNVCPVCLGHPGTLPTINQEAVLKVIKFGLALGGKIAEDSHFDRKSYFYPDLPKGYQISQYEKPLVEGGVLKDIRIRRVHLEEDAARLVHEPSPDLASGEQHGSSDAQKGSERGSSLVDFNRAGTPLMELVTEPDIKNAREAVAFAKELQLILRYLEISDADMEKGQMRVEVNISTKGVGSYSGAEVLDLGTKVEIKNLNSFRAVEQAIDYEMKRQVELFDEGKQVIQETRGWDDVRKKTVSRRFKEESHDYRYFPEPDLPPLDLREFNLESLRAEIPELPEQKRYRFIQEFGLNEEQAEILISDKETADYFEAAASELKSQIPNSKFQTLVNYFTSDLRGLMTEKGINISEININPEHFAHLVALAEKGELSSRLAKDLLLKMFETGEDPETLMKEGGIKIMGDIAELEAIVKEIIEKNPKAVEDYKKGKANALQFLVGQAMARTKGQASPEKLKELFKKHLG